MKKFPQQKTLLLINELKMKPTEMVDVKTFIKNSLNLPTTKFPMKADLIGKEPAWQKKLYAEQVYESLPKHDQYYGLHDGPPYANGPIHIGHAINKVIKDIYAKNKRLNGFTVPFVPGWDTHGLPIELAVEKSIGKVGENFTKAEFRKACRKYAYKQIEGQKKQFKKLSILADWENPYLTMNYATEADTLLSLGKIIANGHVKHALKPVHWCFDCQSSLAEAEVEYSDVQSCSMDVIFLSPTGFGLVIHTTTPWTLMANEAVAIGQDIIYRSFVVAKDNKETLIAIADNMVESWLEKTGYKAVTDVHRLMTGKDILHFGFAPEVFNPLTKKYVPVVLSSHVTDTMGTGAVHIAPAYGVDDMQVGKDNRLPITDVIDGEGCYTTSLLHGKHIGTVNQDLIGMLGDSLAWHGNITHSYPHCWRHKTKTVFRATPQWFITMDTILNNIDENVDSVKFVPEKGKNRFSSMIKNRPDWCISRQRTWGVPIAVYYHQDTKELHPDTCNIITEVAEKIKVSGVDVWDEYPMVRDEVYLKCTDILDVWFDSGVTHETVMKGKANLYIEGSDQHRGWFQTSMLTSLAMNGKPCFDTVVTHGFALDKHGIKMSKSNGNVISPEELIEKYGTDVVRLWIACTDFTNDIKVSHEALNHASESFRRIRNTMKYLLSTSDTTDLVEPTFDQLVDFDKYILLKAEKIGKEINEHYENFRFHDAMNCVISFCTDDLGGLYIDIVKDRQYTMPRTASGGISSRFTSKMLLGYMLRWTMPVLSFTADEVYQYVNPGTNIFVNPVFYKVDGIDSESKCLVDWDRLLLLRPDAMKQLEQLRSDKKIGSSLEATLNIPLEEYEHFKPYMEELKFFFMVSFVHYGDTLHAYPVPSDAQKCDRCWNYTLTPGRLGEWHICQRCATNMCLDGESRYFV